MSLMDDLSIRDRQICMFIFQILASTGIL
ncbi:unnamed protein product [Debaryomyces tyrocola]|nr:unnamed protein product [Debaryomyces tyrocola]